MSKSINKMIIVLIFINFLIILASGFMMPVWAEFVGKIGGDIRTAGKAICIFSIIIGTLTCVFAKLEGLIRKDKLFLMASQLIMLGAYSGYLLVHQAASLYLVQILLGFGGALQSPALYSLYHQVIQEKNTTFYWGIWNGFYNIAIGLGSLISAYLVAHFGFNAMFYGLIFINFICLLCCLKLPSSFKQASF